MLQLYREKNHGRLPGSISTFGFGYGVQSSLLRDLAVVGGGTYAFIPDSGFVGTAFVNALANQLATMGSDAVLSVELPCELTESFCEESGSEGCLVGQSERAVTSSSWGVSVNLGSVKYGQSKDVLLRFPLPEGASLARLLAAGSFVAKFSFMPFAPSRGNH